MKDLLKLWTAVQVCDMAYGSLGILRPDTVTLAAEL